MLITELANLVFVFIAFSIESYVLLFGIMNVVCNIDDKLTTLLR